MRTIAHVDMDAFFASVETLRNPEYRGKPVIVGGDPKGRRGVVATCSYEARVFGVRSAMPMAEAVRRCPHAIFLRPDMRLYSEYAAKAFDALNAHSPVVERASIDEAYLDMTGCEHFYPSLEAMAQSIQDSIAAAVQLPASVGVGPNKLVAKLASGAAKPNGVKVVREEDVQAFLDPLPVADLLGVGKQTAPRLRRIGVQTVRQLRTISLSTLQAAVGANAAALIAMAHGRDERIVQPEAPPKSMSRERTFEHDVADPAVLRRALAALVADVGERLRRRGLWGGVIFVKVRTPDFVTTSRQRKLASPLQDDDRLFQEASALFHALHRGGPLRLLGVGVTELTSGAQTSLFPEDARFDRISEAIDAINQKHRRRIVQRGRERFVTDPP